MSNEAIRRSPDGELHVLTLHHCSTSALALILNRQVPFVCVIGHMPKADREWWHVKMPVTPDHAGELEVSAVRYDFQTETERFLKLLPYLTGGIELAQFQNRIAPALLREDLPIQRRNHIWKANGLFLKFTLPHENETATVACIDESYLEELINKLAIGESVS